MTTRHHFSAFRLRPLRCVIIVSLTLASLTATAQITAQTPAVETGAARDWNLPTAPLANTLAHIARDSGRRLSADPALVEGKTAAPVHGNLSAIDAVRQALVGTGLKLVVTEGGMLSVQPAPTSFSSPVTTLAEMKVTGTMINPGVTEGTGSYTTNQSSYGKGQTLKELPQTITIITHERIQDQQLKTLDDALEYTPGVTVTKESTTTSNFYSRGFEITNFQIDGNSPLLSQSVSQMYAGGLNTSQLDLAMFDSIEVLRGSDALYGTSSAPGGAINLVRKKPTSQLQIKALAHAGSWNNYRGELDIGGSIMANGRIRGRLVGVYEDREYFYDIAKNDKYLFYGIIEADITNSTLLTVGGDFMRQDGTNWREGLPRYSNGADLGLPRSTFFSTNDDRWLRKNNKLFIRLDQAIGTDWTLGIEASRMHSKTDDSRLGWWGGIDPITFSGFSSSTGHGTRFDRDETQKTLDAVLKGAFHLLGREHKVIFGTNINRYKSGIEANRHIGSSNIQIPNIFEFDPADYRFDDPYYLASTGGSIITQKGLYGSLAAKIADPITLIVGGRFSWYKYDEIFSGFDQDTGAVTFIDPIKYKDSAIFTPYLGLVFDITKQWSAYGSIAETYQSQASNRKGPLPGRPLDPVTGRSYEIGVKGNLFNERLNTALAFFSIKRNGQAVRDPAYPPTSGDLGSSCCWLDDGRITSQGIDIEVSGEIVSGWQIQAGYTFNDNENKAESGRYSTVTPKHLFKLWSSYALKGMFNGLKLGGGITAQSSNSRKGTARTFNSDSGRYNGPSIPFEFTEPGRVLVDLFAQYRFNKHWSATANINNVFDKKYYQTVGYTYEGNWYGTPRNFLVSMQYSY